MTREFEPLSPACQPCPEKSGTCFPGPCKLYQERQRRKAEARDADGEAKILRRERDILSVVNDGLLNELMKARKAGYAANNRGVSLREALTDALDKFDAVGAACPARVRHLGPNRCPECRAEMRDGCGREIGAAYALVATVRKLCEESEA